MENEELCKKYFDSKSNEPFIYWLQDYVERNNLPYDSDAYEDTLGYFVENYEHENDDFNQVNNDMLYNYHARSCGAF